MTLNLHLIYINIILIIIIFYILQKLLKELPDLKNNTLLLSYVEKLSSLFVYLDEKSLNKIKLEGNMFCLSENINFTRDLFVKALEDIEDKGMPLLKGVLFTSIKRQADIKNSKIKINSYVN